MKILFLWSAKRFHRYLLLGIPLLAVSAFAEDLYDLPLQDVLNLEVTSVSKREESVKAAPAAVYVLTSEDIRRSGATSIPEVLKLVPGLNVARINNHTWAISARGFNSNFGNKMLVLMDGRALYNPVFSGVYWDTVDYLLEDIDRIEVIRGPGATLWGANAVNGVINIITKSARDTQGGFVTALGGKEEQFNAGLRYGAALSENAEARVYSKGFVRDNARALDSDEPGFDSSSSAQGGFRIDGHDEASTNQYTVEGNIYNLKENEASSTLSLTAPQFVRTDISHGYFTGQNVLSRWTHKTSNDSETSLQIYYDHYSRNEDLGNLDVDTYDVDFQNNALIAERHRLTWGLGYRFISDETRPEHFEFPILLDPRNRDYDVVNGFLQDEFPLFDNAIRLTVGSKFEQNDYTGFEVQPNVRLSSNLSENTVLWASVARALRTPSRVDRSVVYPASILQTPEGTPIATIFYGDKDKNSEELISYELGYRQTFNEHFSADLTTFYNSYDNLFEFSPSGPVGLVPDYPVPILPFTTNNEGDARAFGAEMLFTWRPVDWWKLESWYAFLNLDIEGANSTIESFESRAPKNTAALRSMLNLTKEFEIDLFVNYLDSIPGANTGSIFDGDIRLSWLPTQTSRVSFVVQNVMHSSAKEYEEPNGVLESSRIERAYFLQTDWHF